MAILLQTLFWLISVALLGVAVFGLHRLLLRLENRGYIYYRKKPRGGGGVAFLELDRLVRPSIEHVQRANDVIVESQENDGE
jgi:hypothetical protein